MVEVKKKGHILVVDDEQIMRDSLSAWLTEDGFDVISFDSGKKAVEAIQKTQFDVVLVDLKMPDYDGIEVLRHTKMHQPQTSVIIITAYATVDSAIEAMKAGANDYITKPFNPEEVSLIIHNLISHQNLLRENIYLRKKLKSRYNHHNIISKSHAMEHVFDLISTVADTRSTVLIQGDSGTGKELIARAIHDSSKRQNMPFISVSCAALVETLLESELFGHEKGAFTDAKYQKKGKFELADTGTLFLDEIGDITPKLQMSLLRVLQEKEFTRVGGEKTFRVDVRVIAATNKDLARAVREGAFRDDLYYRINVITINIPPLRERIEDIPLLVDHFIEKFNYENGRGIEGISEKALQILLDYHWPGNVREIENVIERAIIISKGKVIKPGDLPQELTTRSYIDELARSNASLQEVEKQHISRVLESRNWNIQRSSKILQIDRTTLY
jgi:DNA-binding NtrC family response regulator